MLRVLAFLLLLVFGPWFGLDFYLAHFGVPARAKVLDLREAVYLKYDDWRRDHLVTFRYPVQGQDDVTATQAIDASLYGRLKPGDSVPVRYSRSAFMRGFGTLGVKLEESGWRDRLPSWSNQGRSLAELGAVAATVLLAYMAYRRRSRSLGLLAATAGGIIASGIFLLGFLVYPLLLVLWLKRRMPGAGAMLLITFVLGHALLLWRIPWPEPVAAGALTGGSAVVREVHPVRRVWGGQRQYAVPLNHPYDLIDLELAAIGTRGAVHAVDAIDTGSTPALGLGASVRVLYPAAEPERARLAQGTRRYAQALALQLFFQTLGFGLVALVILWPMSRWIPAPATQRST